MSDPQQPGLCSFACQTDTSATVVTTDQLIASYCFCLEWIGDERSIRIIVCFDFASIRETDDLIDFSLHDAHESLSDRRQIHSFVYALEYAACEDE